MSPSVPTTVVNPESTVESPVVSASVPNPAPTGPTKPVSTPKKSNGVVGAKTAATKDNGTAKPATPVKPVATKPVPTSKVPPKTTSNAGSSVKKGPTTPKINTENGKKPGIPTKAPVKAPIKSSVSKTSVPAKPTTKAGNKPTPVKKAASKAKKESKPRGESIRSRIFKMLAKAQDGLTEQEVRERLGYEWNMGPQGPILKAEGCCENPRIKRAYVEGTRAAKFFLTARGKKAVEKGTVDSERAAKSAGVDWPDAK